MAKLIPEPHQIPSGLCECGCGQKTNLASQGLRSTGVFAGYPQRYVHGHGRRTKGAQHHLWKGGRLLRYGYVLIYAPRHPMSDGKGYIPEHRLIVSQDLGRPLSPSEHVHHRNGDKTDNRIENLQLVGVGEHRHIHIRQDAPRLVTPELRAKLSAAGKKGAAKRWGK